MTTLLIIMLLFALFHPYSPVGLPFLYLTYKDLKQKRYMKRNGIILWCGQYRQKGKKICMSTGKPYSPLKEVENAK